MAWIGQIEEEYEHSGQNIVIRADIGDHPVILRSGDWQLEGITGTKEEFGPGAVEFSGLGPGFYTAELVNLGEFTFELKPDHFMLIHFFYGLAPTPTPTPKPGEWVAAITSNTSGSVELAGAFSILTIQIGGVNDRTVNIITDAYQTQCVTGTKPELGDGVCEVGGLWPGVYRVEPEGIPVSIDVPLDGRGSAWVAFWRN